MESGLMAVEPPRGELQQLLDDVSIARPHLAARRSDLHSERLQAKRFHYYAIDTNIIYFIGQPITKVMLQEKINPKYNYIHNFDQRQVPHIGSIFRSDSVDFHLIVGASLARYISSYLTGPNSLLLPTALWPEVDTMLAHFATMDDPVTLKLADKLFTQLLARTVDGLLAQLDFEVTDGDAIRRSLRVLIQQKIGRHQGLGRLQDMLRGGRIDSLAARPVKTLSRQRRLLADWQSEQRELEDRLVRDWDAALLKAGKKSSPHRHLDARALTQIQLRNMFAEELNSSERVIYVTADAHVLLAAADMPADGTEGSFAEAYVRHPISFLNDIGLGFGTIPDVRQTNPADEPASILDWIDVLLAESTDLQSRSDSNAANEIRLGWRALSKVQEDQLFVQLGIEEIERLAHNEISAGDPKRAVANLQEAAMKGEADAWRRCFDVGIELALRKNQSDHQLATRSSPPICFEAWPEAGAAIEQFKLWGADGVPTRKEYDEVRKQLETGEDKTGYAYYLASAAFFAARGDWEPAAGLAAFSRSVANQHGFGKGNGANGREANYFEAVARRHLAKSPADLARSAELLGECLRIYTNEKAIWAGRMGIVPERFDLEKLDFSQTEFLFRWHAGMAPAEVEAVIGSLLAGYGRLQETLAPQVDSWLHSQIPKPILGSEGYALIQCEVRTIISALLLFTIDELPISKLPAKIICDLLDRLAVLRKKTAQLTERIALPPTQDSSFLAGLAIALAEALVSEATRQRQNRPALREARREVNRPVLRSRLLYPFDPRRFDAMRTILQRNLGK
jgi:hypothetical protein